ncbi:hypothetical protein L1987_17918 [Smallanthus sonchifolius]|uniref:Uncharacterized protein n=1 Tax=Smallanthus sonchifolius TaxID=185202 RepID=A0ACB9J0U0_9ASTR|nr:hypothetical protein L1987_17918 [Smallanthus sonchifolius]
MLLPVLLVLMVWTTILLKGDQQQKDDVELAHERSEPEKLKQDIANANKHILNISKTLLHISKRISRTKEELFEINGIDNKAKVSKYGGIKY